MSAETGQIRLSLPYLHGVLQRPLGIHDLPPNRRVRRFESVVFFLFGVVDDVSSEHQQRLIGPVSPPRTNDDQKQTAEPHLDSLISHFMRVWSRYPRIHESPKLLPPFVVFIKMRVVVRLGDRLRRRGCARIRRRSWHGRGRCGAVPSILDRSQYAFSVGHEWMGGDWSGEGPYIRQRLESDARRDQESVFQKEVIG